MFTPGVTAASSFIGSLDAGTAKTYEDKIRDGCAEFERILLRQMLREVRSGSLVQSSSESQSYMELGDDRLADILTQSGGLGLGKAMAEQFLGQIRTAKALQAAV